MKNDRRTFASATMAALVCATMGGQVDAANAAPDRSTQQVIDLIVGGWSLASRTTTSPDGAHLSDPGLSVTPTGVLIYDRTGHVAAQLSRRDRSVAMLPEECREAEKVRGTDDTAQTILGYDAYFGTYTVDPKAGVVTHHLESALFPGDIGKDIKRKFRVSKDTLTISFSTTLRDGTPVLRTLVWSRMR